MRLRRSHRVALEENIGLIADAVGLEELEELERFHAAFSRRARDLDASSELTSPVD